MSDISETSFWLKFFTDAGIPPSDATEYAITFIDNRIKEAMLLDLNKDYLKDMGITVMGDIIAILKHSKHVSGQVIRSKTFLSSVNPSTLKIAPSPPPNLETPSVKKSTAVTRMLEHYVRKDPPLPPPPPPSPPSSNLFSSLSKRLGGTKRTIEDDDVSQSSKRSSVFNRLGDNLVSSTTSDSPKITITMMGKDITKSSSSSEVSRKTLFRLVNNGRGRSSSPKEEEKKRNALQYHGVLKYPSREIANQKLMLEKPSSSKTANLSNADALDIRRRLGVSSKPISISEGIFAHEMNDFRKSKPDKLKVKSGSSLGSTMYSQRELSPSYTGSLSGKSIIKKIVKINKKTGQIVNEEKREIRSTVFNRLGE